MVIEDGSGVVGADTYGGVDAIDEYWAGRSGPLQNAWFTAMRSQQVGAAKEASQYVDAVRGQHYLGYRKSQSQGLLWPRVGGRSDYGDVLLLKDGVGNEIPGLPTEIVRAVAELAARAVSKPLAEDAERGGQVKRESNTVGPVSETIEYVYGSGRETDYGVVLDMLAPVLDGTQPGSTQPSWFWR